MGGMGRMCGWLVNLGGCWVELGLGEGFTYRSLCYWGFVWCIFSRSRRAMDG